MHYLLLAALLLQDAGAVLNRAYGQLRLKNYDQAVSGFRQALALDPSQVQVYKDLGYTFQKMG